MKFGLRQGLAALLVAAAALCPAPASAEPSAADKETARALVIEGREKLAAGDAQAAFKDFKAAHAIMNVPTTGLDLAKAQAALGMLIEARATALEVTRLPASPREPTAFTEARPAAAKLAEALAGRIPSLEIRVKGLPASAAVTVTVDGSTIPPEAMTVPRKANPGEHTIEVSARGALTERRSVTLREGETLPIEIALRPLATEKKAAVAGGPSRSPGSQAGTAPVAQPASAAQPSGDGGGVPAWAWGAGAAGLVAIGVGVGFAIDYASVRSTVAENCPDDACDPALYDTDGVNGLQARWNRDLGLVAGVGAAGLIGVGTAVYGIVTAPAARPSDARRSVRPGVVMAPWLSPAGAGASLRGAF